MLLTPQNILASTSLGLLIYEKLLLEKYPRKNILSCLKQGLPVPNPFVAGGQLLIQLKNGIYGHQDLNFPAFKGNAFDFAGHHFKSATLNELYYMLNQTLRLGLRIPSEELLEQLQKTEEAAGCPRFSFFLPPISNTRPSETLSIPRLYRKIVGSDYEVATDQLRKLEGGKEARQYKAAHFPYVTFAGCFEKRGDKHLLKPSGLLVIDFDDLTEVNVVRETLIAETAYETELLFVSPSGRGLKWVTSYPHQQISHLDYFRLLCSYLEAMFGLKADESGKDISRACFICRDEEAFIHRKYFIQ